MWQQSGKTQSTACWHLHVSFLPSLFPAPILTFAGTRISNNSRAYSLFYWGSGPVLRSTNSFTKETFSRHLLLCLIYKLIIYLLISVWWTVMLFIQHTKIIIQFIIFFPSHSLFSSLHCLPWSSLKPSRYTPALGPFLWLFPLLILHIVMWLTSLLPLSLFRYHLLSEANPIQDHNPPPKLLIPFILIYFSPPNPTPHSTYNLLTCNIKYFFIMAVLMPTSPCTLADRDIWILFPVIPQTPTTGPCAYWTLNKCSLNEWVSQSSDQSCEMRLSDISKFLLMENFKVKKKKLCWHWILNLIASSQL